MTNELLIKIMEKNKLYIKWKTTPINLEKYEEIKEQFKECEKNVIKLIKEAKQQYFDRIFTAYCMPFLICKNFIHIKKKTLQKRQSRETKYNTTKKNNNKYIYNYVQL